MLFGGVSDHRGIVWRFVRNGQVGRSVERHALLARGCFLAKGLGLPVASRFLTCVQALLMVQDVCKNPLSLKRYLSSLNSHDHNQSTADIDVAKVGVADKAVAIVV